MIIETLVVSPFAANCYVIGCEESKSGAIIDPGDEAGRILQTVEQLGLKIEYVLLTHAHIDHIGAAKEVSEATQAPLALHKADLPLLQAGGGGPHFGLPAPPYKKPDLWLKEGDKIRLAVTLLRFSSPPVTRPVTFAFTSPGPALFLTVMCCFKAALDALTCPAATTKH